MARSALLEAGTDARRCVQKAEGKLFPHFLEQGAHLLGLDLARGEGHGRSEQIELLELRVLRCRLFQRAASLDHIGKVHQYPVGHAQYNIKVAQTDIGVDAQRSMSGGGQGRADARHQGGFSGAPFAGGHHICSSQKCQLLFAFTAASF